MRPLILLLLLLLCAACAPSLEDSVGTIARATSIAQQTAVRQATQDTYVDAMTQQAIDQAGAAATVSAAKFTQVAQVENDRLTQEATIRNEKLTQEAVIALDKRRAEETAQAKWDEKLYNEQQVSAAWWAETWNNVRTGGYIVGAVLALVMVGVLWNWDTRRQQAHEQRLQLERNQHAEEMAKIAAIREIEIEKQRAEIDRLRLMVMAGTLVSHNGNGWQVIKELSAPGLPEDRTVLMDGEPVTVTTDEQRRTAQFIVACMDVAGVGAHAKFIPSASKLGMSPKVRDDALKPLRSHIYTTVGAHGGTAIKNGRTLHDLLEMNRKGEL